MVCTEKKSLRKFYGVVSDNLDDDTKEVVKTIETVKLLNKKNISRQLNYCFGKETEFKKNYGSSKTLKSNSFYKSDSSSKSSKIQNSKNKIFIAHHKKTKKKKKKKKNKIKKYNGSKYYDDSEFYNEYIDRIKEDAIVYSREKRRNKQY